MNSWQQILAAYPLLQTIWDAALVIVPLAALMAYSGIFFLSSTAKIIAISRRRSAFDKCSRQLALLGLILGWLLLAGSRLWLYYNQPGIAASGGAGETQNFIMEISWLLLSMGVLLSSIFYSLWHVLKNMPILHATLGMISAVQNCVALMVILFLFTVRGYATADAQAQNALALPDIFPAALDAPIWSALCYSLPLILAMPGAWGSCWLLLRRRKDDFGRDYYNNMISWCCGWARNAWVVLWLWLLASTGLDVWRQMQQQIFNAQDAMLDNARILVWLLPPLLWTAVRRSKPPLRNSFMLWIALIIACLFMLPFFLQLTLS